jgi:hypothetical protein
MQTSSSDDAVSEEVSWVSSTDAESEAVVGIDGIELKALVPVSIRTFGEHGELGNRLTAMRGPLPVGIADPVGRSPARWRR